MNGYWGYFILGYREQLAYLSDSIAGTLNSILAMVASIAIWKAIYRAGSGHEIGFDSLVSYITLMFALKSAFEMDDFFVEKRVRKGLIGLDLIRPLNFRGFLAAYMGGGAAFKIVFQLTPAVLVVHYWVGLQPPASFAALLLAIVSALLGYFVLFNLNFILWVSSFWLHATWSLITIKDAILLVLSGVAFPLWFMPDTLRSVITITPFESIMHAPTAIYIGKLQDFAVLTVLTKQFVWVVILYSIGEILYRRGTRHIVVQGG